MRTYTQFVITNLECIELRREHLRVDQFREGGEVLLVLVDLLDAQQLL